MKQMESSVKETLAFSPGADAFRQILLNAPVAVTITDSRGNILMVNRYFSEITGYSQDELIGENCSILSYKTTPESVYQQLWQTITKGEIWQGQLINRKKSGTLYIADISISGLPGENGETYYYAIHKDITEKHKLQTHQKNQAAMFQAVLNSAPIAIALVDEKNQVLFNNKKYEKLEKTLNSSPVSLLSEVLEAEDGTSVLDTFMAQRQYRNKSLHIDESSESAERWFDFALASIPVTDTAAEAYFEPYDEHYTVVGVIDRSREKRYVEEKRLNTIKLMTSDNKFVHSMQEAMMATLHQLQGPLNMIESAITILKQTNHSCPGLQAMDEAMMSAVTALDDIKQAIPERQNEAAAPVNLNQMVRDVVQISTDQLLASSTNIDFRLTPTLSSVTGKPHRLLLALKQLIDNSVDAIQAANRTDREILVTTRESEDEITLVVEDSGLGIDEEIAIRIFQPFFSTKPKAHSGCRGIGMAIVQQVVNEHAATIEISQSRRLGGARVELIFPVNR